MKAKAMALAVCVIAVSAARAEPARMYDDRPKITVSGEAVVNVKPDKIVISFGIETWDKDMATAKRQNNDIVKKALAAVKDCGVGANDIQTDQISLEPRWDDYQRQKFVGYFVRNTIVVTLSDVSKVEQLVTAALEAGVNYLHGVDFQTTEFKKYREQARELALHAAREKAAKMAAVLGQNIGKPLQISEYGSSPWYWSSWYGWGRGWGRGGGGMSQVQVMADRGGPGEIADTIALGKISVRANVNVTFELTD